jgi:hypothetical protein
MQQVITFNPFVRAKKSPKFHHSSKREKKITKEKSGKFCEAFARFPLLFPFPHDHTFAIEYH